MIFKAKTLCVALMVSMGLFFSGCLLTGCKDSSSGAATLKVGVTAGPHAMIMEKVKEEASKQGLSIQVMEFNDFILPNKALNDKELDANSYQHVSFLKEQNQAMGYNLVALGKTVLMPLGVYPGKVKSLGDLKEGDKIAIPNDPTNGGRALKLLESIGILTLHSCANPTVNDIVTNPKGVVIVELEAPQLPRSIEDVAMAVINTDWVILSHLDPKLAIAIESSDSPYINVLVTREEDKEKENIDKLLKIYHSETIRTYVLNTFKGAVIPAW